MTALEVQTVRDADVNNTAQVLSDGPGLLKSIFISNPNAAIEHVHLYDLATGNVTVGTTVPKLTFGLAASGHINLTELDVNFATAITMAATDEADGGATDPTTGLVVSAVYRDD